MPDLTGTDETVRLPAFIVNEWPGYKDTTQGLGQWGRVNYPDLFGQPTNQITPGGGSSTPPGKGLITDYPGGADAWWSNAGRDLIYDAAPDSRNDFGGAINNSVPNGMLFPGGGYGGSLGGSLGNGLGSYGGSSSMPINIPQSIGAGVALGSIAAGSGIFGNTPSAAAASAQQRNLPAEITALLGMVPMAAGNQAQIQGQLNPYLTQLNLGNYTQTLNHLSPAMRSAYDAANPAQSGYNDSLRTTLDGLNSNGPQHWDPTGYAAVQSANTQGGPASLGAFNSAGPAAQAAFNPAGPAAQASFSPSQAYLAQAQQAQAQQAQAAAAQQAQVAAQQRAAGGPLLARLQSDAMQSVGGVSALQQRQQEIAMGLLGGSGGDLTAQDLRNVQQDTRGAFAARGLYDSNQAIGAEIMNSDAARRQRLVQNMGIASGVDASGQQQIGATRNFALGVQNQGQNLSQFNAGQGNQLGQFNAGQQNQMAQFNVGQSNAMGQFNAGQGNAVSMFNTGQANDISRFNAQNQTQNSQFNSGLGAQVSQFNAGQQNNMGQFNASLGAQIGQFNTGQQNAMGQFNAGQANSLGLANAGAQNQNSQFWGSLGQANNQFNAGQTNAGQQFSANAVNQLGMFNAQMAQQNQNDQWGRSLGFGNYLGQQTVNPFATAMGLQGQAPDYTQPMLGYGQDLNNTNLNSAASAANSRANNNAALTASGLNWLYQIYGKPGS
jgi:hypothetical protein